MTDIKSELGIYYGYPKCCIKEFYSDMTIGIMFVNRKKRTKVAKNGFVPCRRHAILINRKEIKIESLIKNRICPIPFLINNSILNQHCIGRPMITV